MNVTFADGGVWNDASSGNIVWIDFGRTGGAQPGTGTACVVYKAGSSAGEILLSAEL